MGNTSENLQAAFAGESQANRRYLSFAEKADDTGQKQVARLFRAAAEAESIHARNHLRIMGGVRSTPENLEAAAKGENYEFTEMYPAFINQAEAEKNPLAISTFDWASKVEKIHHDLFQKAIDALKSGKALSDKPYFVCRGCGDTFEGEAPERCPICGTSRSLFKRID